MKLKDLLPDILNATSRFRDVITHVILKDKGDHVIILAKSVDGSISISGKSKGPVEDFENIACLGSLDFLKASLDAGPMKEGKLLPAYADASNGKATVLRSITLDGKHGYSVFYQAVDPFVSNLNKINAPKIINWPVLFAVDKDFMERFREAMKVHARAPKIGTDEDDIFTMSFGEGKIDCSFGEKGHQVSMTLSEEVETTGTTDKVNALFSISKLDAVMKLVDKGTGIGYLDSKALRIDIHTKCAEYEFVATAKLKR